MTYYNGQRTGLGLDFLREVRNTLGRVQQHPLAWHPLNAHIRRCQLRRFPYALIYQPVSDCIIILAVAHLHQRPRDWSDHMQP